MPKKKKPEDNPTMRKLRTVEDISPFELEVMNAILKTCPEKHRPEAVVDFLNNPFSRAGVVEPLMELFHKKIIELSEAMRPTEGVREATLKALEIPAESKDAETVNTILLAWDGYITDAANDMLKTMNDPIPAEAKPDEN